MRWILIAIVAVIGVLAIVLPLPQVLDWAPKMANTAMGMGIGCLLSAVGLIFVPVVGRPFVQASGSSSGGVTVIGGAQFSPTSWLEWVVLIVPIVGGIIIGGRPIPRSFVMADAAAAGTRPTVWSLVAAAIFVLVGALLISLTYGAALPAWLRWGAVLVWAVLTGVVVLIDAKLDPTTDSRPVDIWTIAHGFAGIVFGIWFVPFWLIVALTVLWEVFEAVTSGIGDEEVIINRVVDVGIAITLWAAVVLVVMLVQQGTSFPLFPPFHAPFAA